jgi:hypothetical protein
LPSIFYREDKMEKELKLKPYCKKSGKKIILDVSVEGCKYFLLPQKNTNLVWDDCWRAKTCGNCINFGEK